MQNNSPMTTLSLLVCSMAMTTSACVPFATLTHDETAKGAHEFSLLPAYVFNPPRHCLSLSGGGMRAGSYAIGAMKALNEFDQLDSLDVISGVSGGTYAMMWYYAGVYG